MRAVTVWRLRLAVQRVLRVRIVRRRRLRRCYVPRAVTVRAMRLTVVCALPAVQTLLLAAPATLPVSSAVRAVTVRRVMRPAVRLVPRVRVVRRHRLRRWDALRLNTVWVMRLSVHGVLRLRIVRRNRLCRCYVPRVVTV